MDNLPQVQVEVKETPITLIPDPLEIEGKELFFNDKPVKYYSWIAGSEFVATPYDKTCVDMLLNGHTYGECVKAIEKFYRKSLTVSQIKDRLENNEYARSYLEARLKVKAIADGLTKEDYVAMGEEVIRGVRKMTPEQGMVYKHLSKVMGFEGPSSMVQNNFQINIKQMNGND